MQITHEGAGVNAPDIAPTKGRRRLNMDFLEQINTENFDGLFDESKMDFLINWKSLWDNAESFSVQNVFQNTLRTHLFGMLHESFDFCEKGDNDSAEKSLKEAAKIYDLMDKDRNKTDKYRHMTEENGEEPEETSKKDLRENTEDNGDEIENIYDTISELRWITEGKKEPVTYLASDIDNFRFILRNDKNLRNIKGLNEFKKKYECTGPLPWNLDKKPGEQWKDADDAGLRNYIQRKYGPDGMKVNGYLDNAFITEMHLRKFHPVRDYLNSCKWDGTQRLDTLIIDYFGAEDNEYTRFTTRKTFISAVARIFEPGCKVDTVLTLISNQGDGKSSFWRKMAHNPKWFSDSQTTWNGKEAFEQLEGFWILEIAENAVMSKTDVNQAKLFLTKQADDFRAAYGRYKTENERQNIFVITANSFELRDKTGNRRYWPVQCNKENAKYEVKTELTPDIVDQVWAEAVTAYKAGEKWWLDSEQEKIAAKVQDAALEDDYKTGLIEEYLERCIPTKWTNKTTKEERMEYFTKPDESDGSYSYVQRDMVCVAEIMAECFGKKEYKPAEAKEIVQIMNNMQGWEKMDSPKKFPEGYGKQRGWKRVNSIEDWDDLLVF